MRLMTNLPDEIWQYIIEFTECNYRWYHVVRDNKRRQKNITQVEKEIGWLLQHIRKCRTILGSDICEAKNYSYQCLESQKNNVCFACLEFTRVNRGNIDIMDSHISFNYERKIAVIIVIIISILLQSF